ncbi:M28 family peptidase [Vitreoscilla massiliensis]|uniref:M28 family peptidase n=1 Tax=Vitreoscilla massiliensis TaxID=1689272 RepID=A0ABY4E3F1_9NEIS|nr:M28 family peptidase [Vitreoscilla massiliensis]UOO90311.1 M28 family peptidase [Vitreoscilla massiliensis]
MRRRCSYLWLALGLSSLHPVCAATDDATAAVPVSTDASHPNQTAAHADVLSEHIHYLSSLSRHHQHPQGLDQAAAYIKTQIEQYGLPCAYQNYEVAGQTYRNVVCSLSAAQADNTDTVIVGAHYDSYADLPGADDNASGTAGLIELARLLKQQQAQLPQNIELVAYTLEEPPYFRSEHMGSAVHAQSLSKRPINVKAVVILEMIGYYRTEAVQDYPLNIMRAVYPKHGNFIAAVGNWQSRKLTQQYCRHMRALQQLPCERLTAPSSLTGVDFSDHLNYWAHKIPAIMLTDTSFYRNKNYHTAGDTLDTLDTHKAAAVIDGVATWLQHGTD